MNNVDSVGAGPLSARCCFLLRPARETPRPPGARTLLNSHCAPCPGGCPPCPPVALEEKASLPSARLSDLAALLKEKGYEAHPPLNPSTQIPLFLLSYKTHQNASQEHRHTARECARNATAVPLCLAQVHLDAAGAALYACKGILGRVAPIGVHAGLILTLVGCTLSVACSWRGTAMAPEGSAFVVQSALRPSSPLAFSPWGADRAISVNSFSVEYYPSGRVSQFRSDLSVVDSYGNELSRQKVEVNTPLRYGGITAYQTDWSIAAITLRAGAEDAEPVRLPMASLEGAPGFSGRIWGSFLPLGPPPAEGARPSGATVVARDFQSVAVYDEKGAFVGVRRPGSNKARVYSRQRAAALACPFNSKPPAHTFANFPASAPGLQAIEVGGIPIFVDGLTGATGLELKARSRLSARLASALPSLLPPPVSGAPTAPANSRNLGSIRRTPNARRIRGWSLSTLALRRAPAGPSESSPRPQFGLPCFHFPSPPRFLHARCGCAPILASSSRPKRPTAAAGGHPHHFLRDSHLVPGAPARCPSPCAPGHRLPPRASYKEAARSLFSEPPPPPLPRRRRSGPSKTAPPSTRGRVHPQPSVSPFPCQCPFLRLPSCPRS